MAELKPWFRRVRCWLTGGHRYSDLGLVSCYEPITHRQWFGNRCIKCGHFNTWDVDANAIFGDLNRRVGDGK